MHEHDLAAWLREQIAETERDANGAALVVQQACSVGPEVAQRWWYDDANGSVAVYPSREPVVFAPYGGYLNDVGEHIARQDPRAVLAQCEAWTRVLDRHSTPAPGSSAALWMNPRSCVGCGVTGDPDQEVTYNINECPELRDLAVAFQHRPGYREEWRP